MTESQKGVRVEARQRGSDCGLSPPPTGCREWTYPKWLPRRGCCAPVWRATHEPWSVEISSRTTFSLTKTHILYKKVWNLHLIKLSEQVSSLSKTHWLKRVQGELFLYSLPFLSSSSRKTLGFSPISSLTPTKQKGNGGFMYNVLIDAAPGD